MTLKSTNSYKNVNLLFEYKYISLKIIQILLYSNWDLICSVICNFPKMVLTLNLKQDFKWTFF